MAPASTACTSPPSTFTEAQDGIFWLPDEEIDAWERFVLFLYTGKIDLTDPPLAIADSPNPSVDVLCRLWVLGDRRQVPLLMNKCIDAIHSEVVHTWCPPVHMLPYAYANTAPGSALRRFVLLLTARAGELAFDPSIAHFFDEESLRDILRLIWNIEDIRIWRPLEVFILKTCAEYHSHGAGERENCGEEE
ncbi:uncharacterized protein RHO25_010010 [Cercospora beticola]|uniref:BTB domain-containing protein n=1 Tax=Cercospora beticola TaxID=122368 RepID=A0ABZ0P0I9_CERBT|nr:hypothetical protein RHO25_010010 [Cercospora beticola]